MPNRIKEETDDIIIIDENPIKIMLFVLLVFYLFYRFLVFGIISALLLVSVVLPRWYIEVTIDKKLQSVNLQRIIFNNKRLSFSDIKKIEIVDDYDAESTVWKINIVTIQGTSIKIFENNDHSKIQDTRRIAENISKIMNIKRKSANIYSR